VDVAGSLLVSDESLPGLRIEISEKSVKMLSPKFIIDVSSECVKIRVWSEGRYSGRSKRARSSNGISEISRNAFSLKSSNESCSGCLELVEDLG
jgi:hypothetical protein